MKKLLSLLLALLFVLGTAGALVSCSGDKPSETQTETQTEAGTEAGSSTESETEPETETFPPIAGTTDPTDPRFAHYAVRGGYYVYTERFEKNDATVTFDIDARKMSITDKNGKTTLCSYDKNYFLSRIDTPSSLVLTFDNTVSEDGLLTHQAIHYRTSASTREYSITYRYDEDGYISGMTLVDSHLGETLETEFVYCGNGSYLIRETATSAIKYYHLNFLLSDDPLTDTSSETDPDGNIRFSFNVGPFGQTAVFRRASGEESKMFNEYCLFNAMLTQLQF